jgi:hypothetical protein
MNSVIDLVMLYRNCSPYEAAKWISINWKVAGRIQIERSENARGETRHTYRQYRPISIPDKSKPSIQALVASPGWPEMPLSTRVIAMTLFAMVETEENRVVSISRRQLPLVVGIRKSNTIAKAIRELEAIGLFAVDRGLWGDRGWRASTFRLTWWSQAFQTWLTQGYALPSIPPTTNPDGTGNTETLGFHPPPGQRQEFEQNLINSH